MANEYPTPRNESEFEQVPVVHEKLEQWHDDHDVTKQAGPVFKRAV